MDQRSIVFENVSLPGTMPGMIIYSGSVKNTDTLNARTLTFDNLPVKSIQSVLALTDAAQVCDADTASGTNSGKKVTIIVPANTTASYIIVGNQTENIPVISISTNTTIIPKI